MKIRLLLLCVLAIFAQPNYAQFWMQSAGGATVEEAYDVALDASNNTVSVGYFTGTSSFGSTVLTSNGVTDIFVSKLNTNGVVQWAQKAGGTGSDRAFAVKTDVSGNVFVAGYFSGTATFGNISVTSNGLQDVFVAKYNSSGAIQWVSAAGGINNDNCTGLALSPSGDIYITGSFKNTATFGTLTATGHATTTDVFTAKLSSTGVFSWVEVGTGSFNNKGVDIGCDNNGSVYVTGMFSDTVTFDNVHNNNMQNAVFVVKYNSNGVEQWFKIIGGATNNDVTGMKVDGSGNSYLTGNFAGTLTFFGIGSGANSTLPTTYTEAVYLAKLSGSGGVVYTKSIGSNNPITSNSVGIDASGNAVIGGKFECALNQAQATFGLGVFNSIGVEDMFICKYSTTGAVQLFRHIGGQGANEIFGVTLDNIGEVYVAGSYEDELVVPTNGTFSATNLALFTQRSYPQNNGYCADASYGEFYSSMSAGNKDIWVGKCFAPTRAPLDFYQRSGSTCMRDIRPVCFDSVCSSSITNCQVILHANTNTLPEIDPDFSFSWSNNVGTVLGDTAAEAPLSGMYHLTATANNGCIDVTDSINVTVLPAPTTLLLTDSKGVNVNETAPDIIELCVGDTATLTGLGGGLAGTYGWTGPGLPAGGIADSVAIASQAGIYEFVAISTAGCTLSLEVTVEYVMPLQPWGLKMEVADSHQVCDGDYIIPYLYDTISNPTGISQCLPDSGFELVTTYSINPVVPISTGCNTYGSFLPDSTGTFTITATVIRSNACGSDTSTVVKAIYVEVLPSPVIPPFGMTITGGNVLCPGGSLTLTASGGTSFNWFGPGIQLDTNASITVTQSGTFGVVSVINDTNSFGCTASATNSATITVIDKVQPTISATNQLICPNDSVGLSCSANNGLSWFGPNGPIGSTNPVYVTDPGAYYCVVNDADSCNLVTNTIIISQYTTPFLQAIGDSILCPGDTTQITAAVGANSVIEWQAPLSGNNPVQTITSPGVYTCKITACGIESYASITIYSPSLLAQFTVSGPLCADSFITLSADTNLASYLWSPTGDTTSSITVSSPGDYSLFVSEANGCTGQSDTVTIDEFNVNAYIDATGTAICPDDSVMLTAMPIGGSVVWNGFNSTDPSIWVSQPGTYSVVVTDTNGCSEETAPFTIAFEDTSAQITVMGDTLICSDDSVQLITNAFDSASYLWMPTADTSASIWVSEAGSYTVEIIDDNGCNRFAGPVEVSVEQNTLIAPELISDTLVCQGKFVSLWANSSAGSPHWYAMPEDSLVHTGDVFEVKVNSETTYRVAMQTGVCTSENSYVTVQVEDCYGYTAGNIFTPNRDGYNDFFQVYVKEATCYHLEIYNRWGNLVHKSDLANSEWDGTMITTGETLSDGVYYWLLDYCDIDGKKEQVKGYVTLSRGK